MRAGKYNTPIQIVRKQVTTTEYGTDKVTYEVVANTKASVEYVSGNRIEENREIFFTQQLKFTVRHYIQVENEDRIVCKGLKYRILSIQDEGETTKNDKIITTELINE